MASILQRTEEIRNRMERTGLARVAADIQALVRPSIRLKVGKLSSLPITRLGGAPNFPADFPWPTRKDGQPHSFLAQIDLAQLESFDGLTLPRSGSLFFFCDTVDIPAGYDPGDNDGYKDVYSPSPLSDGVIRKTPRGLKANCIYKGYSLEPTLDLTGPGEGVWEIECLCLNGSESDAYSRLFVRDGSAHRIGGYPEAVQNGDLGLTAELVSHGIYCGDSRGFREGKSRGLEAGAANWRLLLQLDSDEDAGMMWGDVGRLYFMIREEDLKTLSFNRVWMGMECG